MSLALDPCGRILSRDTKHHHYGATPRSPTPSFPMRGGGLKAPRPYTSFAFRQVTFEPPRAVLGQRQ